MNPKESSFFLEALVAKLQNEFSADLSRVCLVTPNRRAQTFVRRFFKENGKATLLPQMFSIDDFIQHLSPFTLFDSIDLTFEFYMTYKELEGEQAQPFELFIQWASVLINDFNELDMHLADSNAVFSYLSDAYAIREWNLGRDELTDFQKNYLAFFHKLNDYYHYFTQRLLMQKGTYNGMAYRYVAEHIEPLIETQNWDKIIFAGFNALTAAEEKIIRLLYESKQAEIVWDIDQYYYADKNQEAGLFFHKYANWYPFTKQQISTYYQEPKNIDFIAVPRAVGQAKIAAELLRNQQAAKAGNSLDNTALVLADETLLMPVLNSLDEEVLKETNVTMGYPLKDTATHALFRMFVKMQSNAQRLQRFHPKEEMRFLQEDILRILQNPLTLAFFCQDKEAEKNIKKQLYWTEKELSLLFVSAEKALSFLFVSFENDALKAIAFFQQFIHKTAQQYLKVGEALQQQFSSDWEALLLYDRLLNRLEDRLRKYAFSFQLAEFRLLFEQLLGSQSQAFYGEPLKGLQLMGLLETRLLDFENVLLLSANEDIFPLGKMENSFIPVDVKRTFGLPTYQEKNAVYAYHFYRLLQRAKKVYLFYSTTTGKLSGGEKSRFLTQLMVELPQYNPQTILKEKVHNFRAINPGKPFAIAIEKEQALQKLLIEKAGTGISPTALNTYVMCPLRFYFRFVLGLKEPEEQESIIDDRMLGNIAHHSLEQLYKPFVGKPLSPQGLDNIVKQMPAEVQKQARLLVKGQVLDSGQNFLTLKAIEKYLYHYLIAEREKFEKEAVGKTDWQVVALEKELEKTLYLKALDLEVKIKGFADRIDLYKGVYRVLDYKTGLVNENDLKDIDPALLFTNVKYNKAVQLLTYAWLMMPEYTKSEVQSGIIALRNIHKPVVFLEGGSPLPADYILNYEHEMEQVLSAIFNPQIPFVQTSEKAHCAYCPFVNICLK